MAKAVIGQGGRKAQVTIDGIQNWGDINLTAWEVLAADRSRGGAFTTSFTIDSAMNAAVDTARRYARKDSGLLRSTIRGKSKVQNIDTIVFELLAGGQGGVKDYFNSAFQRTYEGNHSKEGISASMKAGRAYNRLNIYPSIWENREHYLERGLNESVGKINTGYLKAYELAVFNKAKRGK